MSNAPPERADSGALQELERDPASRKQFLKLMGGGVAATSAFSIFLAACGGDDDKKTQSTESTSTAATQESGDIKIVNYALTLEYLEADFYQQVIDSGLFKGAQQSLIQAIGDHENQHVEALSGTVSKLGGTPAAEPQTKFPIDNPKNILTLAATVENLGAAAYLGQADKIKNKEILAAAISIHSVEARHAAALNFLTGKSPTPDGGFAKPASMDQVLAAVKPFIVS
ncbi:MAG: ferritin-like domain-containing protein [Actinobacteria bacterium]|nr:ferritin-like domain-containing protein [Actinomycetota bacterium]